MVEKSRERDPTLGMARLFDPFGKVDGAVGRDGLVGWGPAIGYGTRQMSGGWAGHFSGSGSVPSGL